MAYTTIDDPSAHFQVTTYSGTGSTASVTNVGNSDLQPDLVWLKCRNVLRDHRVIDSTRGVQEEIVTNSTAAEYTEATGFTAFQSDGFQHGGANGYGASAETYVAWQWKANGGSTSSNTSGAITSTVQANTTAGFSIVKYTGPNDGNDSANNSGAYWSIGHGLGATPEVIILKGYDSTHNWYYWHKSMGAETSGYYQRFNDTLAVTSQANILWGNTAFSSTLFEVGGWDVVNRDPQNYIAYMWTPIQGYSKFGGYTGNGSEDGPFVYTGFKPRWILFKNAGAAEEFVLQDTTRNPDNPVIINIRTDSNIVEASASNIDFDFLSNGFKNRSDQAQVNSDGVAYVYMAFAEHPFVTSGGVPCTAR